MQNRPRRPQFSAHPEASNANITSAIGIEETVGHLRARHNSLYTRTVMWITGLVCTAFLLGSLAQAWSNSQLMLKVQDAQQHLQQDQAHHNLLQQQARYYKDPAVIESEARQQLGYVRPGENPIVIVSADNQKQITVQQGTSVPVPQSFWQEWWRTFLGINPRKSP